MNDIEYFDLIKPYMEGITQCKKETMELIPDVIGDNLIGVDFCFIGLLDRNIRLADGFLLLIKERNLTCAGALLRLQMDNCMRVLAISIANDEKEIVEYILDGKPISKLKDRDGNRLQDAYLRKKMGLYDKQFEDVYYNASGYIHFSSKAFYQTVEECNDGKVNFHIGGILSEKFDKYLIECATAYLHYNKLFLSFMKQEAIWKKDFDRRMEAGS